METEPPSTILQFSQAILAHADLCNDQGGLGSVQKGKCQP